MIKLNKLESSCNKLVSKNNLDIIFRRCPIPDDWNNVRTLLTETSFFSEEELCTAIELIDEKLQLEDKSSYRFIFAESGNKLIGYTCYGLIPLTKSSFELYWIAVNPSYQGNGIGQRLISETESSIKAIGGLTIYADTSSRKQYNSTRKFYLSCGFKKAAYFKDFYASSDGKIVFIKRII